MLCIAASVDLVLMVLTWQLQAAPSGWDEPVTNMSWSTTSEYSAADAAGRRQWGSAPEPPMKRPRISGSAEEEPWRGSDAARAPIQR